MRLPKTMKGYISFFINIEESMLHTSMKGFDELPKDLQEEIRGFGTEISNYFNEIRALYENHIKGRK